MSFFFQLCDTLRTQNSPVLIVMLISLPCMYNAAETASVSCSDLNEGYHHRPLSHSCPLHQYKSTNQSILCIFTIRFPCSNDISGATQMSNELDLFYRKMSTFRQHLENSKGISSCSDIVVRLIIILWLHVCWVSTRWRQRPGVFLSLIEVCFTLLL